MQKSTLYLVMAVIGALVPMIAFVPWVAAHGIDLRLMMTELFANRMSTFFALDLLITACVVAVFARLDEPPVPRRWLVILVMVCMGVSAAPPLLLYLREKLREKGSAEAAAI
jgi:hypothetical protein